MSNAIKRRKWSRSGKLFRLTPLLVVRADVPPDAPEGPLAEQWVQELREGPTQLFVGDLADAVVLSMPSTTSSASFQAAARALQVAFPDRPCLIITHAVHFLHAEPVNPVDARRLIEKIGVEEGAQAEAERLASAEACPPGEPAESVVTPEEKAELDALLEDANTKVEGGPEEGGAG